MGGLITDGPLNMQSMLAFWKAQYGPVPVRYGLVVYRTWGCAVDVVIAHFNMKRLRLNAGNGDFGIQEVFAVKRGIQHALTAQEIIHSDPLSVDIWIRLLNTEKTLVHY